MPSVRITGSHCSYLHVPHPFCWSHSQRPFPGIVSGMKKAKTLYRYKGNKFVPSFKGLELMTSLWFWRSSASRYSRNRKSKSEKMKFGKSTLKNSVQEVLKIGCQFKASSKSTKYALSNMPHMITLTCKSSYTNTNSKPSKWKTHKMLPPTAGIWISRRGSVQLECDDPHR